MLLLPEALKFFDYVKCSILRSLFVSETHTSVSNVKHDVVTFIRFEFFFTIYFKTIFCFRWSNNNWYDLNKGMTVTDVCAQCNTISNPIYWIWSKRFIYIYRNNSAAQSCMHINIYEITKYTEQNRTASYSMINNK